VACWSSSHAAAGQFHVPGVDAAFTSAATTCGADTIGVLLTGMGRDGAIGLRKMRDQGGLTIGQDEPTSVVWGMPAAAQALGAVECELRCPASPRRSSTGFAAAAPPSHPRPPNHAHRRSPMSAQLSDNDLPLSATTSPRPRDFVFDENRRAGLAVVVADRLPSIRSPRRRELSHRAAGQRPARSSDAAARRGDGAGNALLPQRPADGRVADSRAARPDAPALPGASGR